jgi:hypothetical protein
LYFATDLGTNGTLLTWDGSAWRGRVVYKSGVSFGTGNTTNNTVVRSVQVPSGLMQANSSITFDAYFGASATQTYSLRVYMDSTASGTTNLLSQAASTATTIRQLSTSKTIFNRNATNSQQSYLTNNAGLSQQGSTTANDSSITFSLETANEFFINFAIQKGAAGDVITLNYSSVIIEI